jgi:high affinity Mn2+ porin
VLKCKARLSLPIGYIALAALLTVCALAQDLDEAPGSASENERWNLFFQATSVGQYHGTFYSPYSGPYSLQSYPERDVSLTTTLFFGLRLDQNTQLYFDPEIAGGRGFSGVNGMTNSSNGELPRVCIGYAQTVSCQALPHE